MVNNNCQEHLTEETWKKQLNKQLFDGHTFAALVRFHPRENCCNKKVDCQILFNLLPLWLRTKGWTLLISNVIHASQSRTVFWKRTRDPKFSVRIVSSIPFWTRENQIFAQPYHRFSGYSSSDVYVSILCFSVRSSVQLYTLTQGFGAGFSFESRRVLLNQSTKIVCRLRLWFLGGFLICAHW